MLGMIGEALDAQDPLRIVKATVDAQAVASGNLRNVVTQMLGDVRKLIEYDRAIVLRWLHVLDDGFDGQQRLAVEARQELRQLAYGFFLILRPRRKTADARLAGGVKVKAFEPSLVDVVLIGDPGA